MIASCPRAPNTPAGECGLTCGMPGSGCGCALATMLNVVRVSASPKVVRYNMPPATAATVPSRRRRGSKRRVNATVQTTFMGQEAGSRAAQPMAYGIALTKVELALTAIGEGQRYARQARARQVQPPTYGPRRGQRKLEGDAVEACGPRAFDHAANLVERRIVGQAQHHVCGRMRRAQHFTHERRVGRLGGRRLRAEHRR